MHPVAKVSLKLETIRQKINNELTASQKTTEAELSVSIMSPKRPFRMQAFDLHTVEHWQRGNINGNIEIFTAQSLKFIHQSLRFSIHTHTHSE